MKQNRYPLVLVERNYATGETIISQESFSPQKEINKVWWIPVTFATKTNPDFSNTSFFWLTPENRSIILQLDPDDWIIVNLQQYGKYGNGVNVLYFLCLLFKIFFITAYYCN